jgi:hypothetical protein
MKRNRSEHSQVQNQAQNQAQNQTQNQTQNHLTLTFRGLP